MRISPTLDKGVSDELTALAKERFPTSLRVMGAYLHQRGTITVSRGGVKYGFAFHPLRLSALIETIEVERCLESAARLMRRNS